MTQRVCKRCLLRELDGTYFQSIYEYIQNLFFNVKAYKETYAHRLALCKACGHLVNGMCELCGCFVEVRAAKINQHCAETAQRW